MERVILAIVVGEMIASAVGVTHASAGREIHAIADGEMIVSVVGQIRAMILAHHLMTHVMKIVRTLTHVTQTVRVTIHVSIQNAPTTMSAIALVVL